jgi:small subunit ribosomal protein S18
MPPRKPRPKDATRKIKKKVCIFCKDKSDWVDYKDVNLLRRFMSDRGKIRARRVTGNCAQHQRDVAIAIKTARELALLPYSQRMVTEGRGRPPKGDRDDRRGGGGAVEGLEVDVDLDVDLDVDGDGDVDVDTDVEVDDLDLAEVATNGSEAEVEAGSNGAGDGNGEDQA